MIPAIGIAVLFTGLLFIALFYFGRLAAKEDAECSCHGRATVMSVSQVDPSPDSMVRLALELKIDSDITPNEPIYTGRFLQCVQILHASRFTPGASMLVRFDQSNPTNLRFLF